MTGAWQWLRRPFWQRAGNSIGLFGRHLAGRLFGLVLPVPANQRVQDLPRVRSVLLVRPNFRIGNTILATPLIPALRQLFPGAELHVLGSETTEVLLEHLGIDRVHVVSRRFAWRPWQLVALFRRLRAANIDVAVEAGMGSFSGGLYAWLSGARYRIGVEGDWARFLNVRVPRPRFAHAYDRMPSFARSLGVDCADSLIYRVAPEENAAAARILRDSAVTGGDVAGGFVAVFVGGHLGKRLPHEQWIEILAQLERAGVRFAVLVGPEEGDFQRHLAANPTLAKHLLRPQPLRVFAAILARAAMVVTTDSGPMHLAVALGRPTIALLALERSRRFQPRGSADRVLMTPSAGDVVGALRVHPAWSSVARDVA